MPCFRPLRGFQVAPGSPLSFSCPVTVARVVEVPCGSCVGCKLERARRNAVRCCHEASLYDASSFVTFTYDDDHLPPFGFLRYRDYQLFMKRLRERVGPVRFFMCGEYGGATLRPHFHACLFGFLPVDRVFYKTTARGDRLYTSELLDDVWGCGSCFVGSVSFHSAGYVARYMLKGAELVPPAVVDFQSGEILEAPKPFCRMSLKPGLGAVWFERYMADVYPRDYVVLDGVKSGVPPYYDKLLERLSPVYLAELKAARSELADVRFEDNFPKRLRVKEQVTKAAISFLSRE